MGGGAGLVPQPGHGVVLGGGLDYVVVGQLLGSVLQLGMLHLSCLCCTSVQLGHHLHTSVQLGSEWGVVPGICLVRFGTK